MPLCIIIFHHVHHRHRVVLNPIPDQQPAAHFINLVLLLGDDALAKLPDRRPYPLYEAVVRHIQRHLVMVDHPYEENGLQPALSCLPDHRHEQQAQQPKTAAALSAIEKPTSLSFSRPPIKP